MVVGPAVPQRERGVVERELERVPGVAWGARDGLLSGIRPWAPDYVGEGWQGMALFDAPVDGVALARPGLAAVTEGLTQSRKRQVA